MVDVAHLDKVMGDIVRAESEGARLLLGGHRADVEAGGCYVQPTVFDQVSPTRHWRRARKYSGRCWRCSALTTKPKRCAWPNDSRYGLAAGLWTRDLGRAHRVARQLRAGSVWVNGWDAVT